MATTERWDCKKHLLQYSKAKAVEHNYKCSVIEGSTCPECSSSLKLERLSSGQFYLDCTNCSWNSYEKTPGLFFPSKENLAREAVRYGLAKGFRICNKKLRHIIGKEVCPNCFISLLKRGPVTNFSTIMNSFNIPADQMVKLIEQYLEEERIYGILDQQNQMFYYISPEMRDKLLGKFQEEGVLKIADLAMMLDVGSEIALQLIYKYIGQFQIKGSFAKDKKIYYTQKYIMDKIIETINRKGRISIQVLAGQFNIPIELTKTFCVNLMRAKSITAFFADRGAQIITSNQIIPENKDFSTQKRLSSGLWINSSATYFDSINVVPSNCYSDESMPANIQSSKKK